MDGNIDKLLRNGRKYPLGAVTATDGISPNEGSEAVQRIMEADIVVGVDVMTRRHFLVHGSEMVELCLGGRAGVPEARVIKIELDENNKEELETLLAIASALHGHHDYRPGPGFLGQPTELDVPVIGQTRRGRPLLWMGGSIARLLGIFYDGTILPTNLTPDPRVRPVAWFYTADYHEALRSAIENARACEPQGGIESYLASVQFMRIGISPERAPVGWEEFVRTSGISRGLARSIRQARPNGWPNMAGLRGSYTAVDRSDWAALEIFGDLGDWIPLTRRRLDQMEGLLLALGQTQTPPRGE